MTEHDDQTLPEDGPEVEYVVPDDPAVLEEATAPDTEVETAYATALRAGLEEFELDAEDAALIEGGDGFDEYGNQVTSLPVVAIVGRPNVGKSSLVNRFIGRREAVVEDHPGVTRDRVSYITDWGGRRFWVQDTGGWDPDAKGIHAAIARQAEAAMATSDVIVMVVDAKTAITETDAVMARNLQRSEVPVILVANKFESDSQWGDVAEFYALGLGDPWPVSALHGRGSPRPSA